MGALVLMMRMEERSGVKISLLDVFHTRTRNHLAALIADRSATPSVSK
jgi:acyl carrier protein